MENTKERRLRTKMFLTVLAATGGDVEAVVAAMPSDPNAVATPGGCERCEHRDEDVRDGGWCYMFRECPTPSCAQFRPLPESRKTEH